MKTFLILAALAAGVATASAQPGSSSAAKRAGSHNSKSSAPTSISVAPNYSTKDAGKDSGPQKVNTAPATGATRASRSSSGPKTAGQRKPTGSGNIESMSKNNSSPANPKK